MYHYTSVGLDNVWLKNGYTVHQTPYGDGVSIEDTDGLHRMLAKMVASKDGPLSRKELRFLRTYLGLSQEGLGKCVGVAEQTVSLWERGSKLPLAAEAIVRLMVLEATNGTAEIRKIIERINTVEQLVRQRIVASEVKNEWKTKAEPAPPGAAQELAEV